MITKVRLGDGEVVVGWTWKHESGDWWVEIEEVDDAPVADEGLTDEQLDEIRVQCADHYPLGEYQNDLADLS